MTPDATLADRFEAKVRRGAPGECWGWTGSKHPAGYGSIWSRGRLTGAHRASWELAHGPIPEGLCVLHRCDNPPCTNPEHLFLGTVQDNVADRQAKGRTRTGPGAPPPRYSGERNPAARLTSDDVRAIRSAWTGAVGEVSSLARRFRVSRRTIRRVVSGTHWTSVEAYGR